MDISKLKKIAFTNEKGNAKVAERKVQKESAVRGLLHMSEEYADNRVVTKDGAAFAVGYDPATEQIIWAHFSITISEKAPEPDKTVTAKMLFGTKN